MATTSMIQQWDLWEARRDPLVVEAIHVRPRFGPAHTFIDDPICIVSFHAAGVIVVYNVMH